MYTYWNNEHIRGSIIISCRTFTFNTFLTTNEIIELVDILKNNVYKILMVVKPIFVSDECISQLTEKMVFGDRDRAFISE